MAGRLLGPGRKGCLEVSEAYRAADHVDGCAPVTGPAEVAVIVATMTAMSQALTVCGRTPEHAVARSSTPGTAGLPGFWLVIGMDGDPRAWVRVANALLDRIASGVLRVGSRVPSVTGLGLESPVAPGTAARAFRALAGEGVLHWVPGRGYYVQTGFTVPVSDRARQDGRLTAVLPGGARRLRAAGGRLADSNAER